MNCSDGNSWGKWHLLSETVVAVEVSPCSVAVLSQQAHSGESAARDRAVGLS